MTSVADETRVAITSDADIVTARQRGRELARKLGFPAQEQTLIATAISEVARNILEYATRGEIILTTENRPDANHAEALVVIARDEGPGIPSVERAMQDGYSTSRGLGLGLPGSRRLMDEFHIVSEVGKGTTITMKKWVR
jgi:serine/threonine-protein kinase RsbT